MIPITENQLETIGNVLNDEKRPLKERFRALFTLKNIGGNTAINLIAKSFKDPSALLKHELAYCLGQMQDEKALNVLISVLKDETQEPIVRHEAAEALGAIGSEVVIPLLENYKKDPIIEVAETCQLAMDRIEYLRNLNEDTTKDCLYNSVDPAPPSLTTDINQLKTSLTNENLTLFDRYRAMFALRNLGTSDAVETLGKALKCGNPLFKHEIAFVLGQMQNEHSVPYLIDTLENVEENEMVRHECAEALGAIATEECTKILNKYLNDSKRVVRESCVIALDMCEYENSPEFQYANTLSTL